MRRPPKAGPSVAGVAPATGLVPAISDDSGLPDALSGGSQRVALRPVLHQAMRCVAECFVKVRICWSACAPKV